MNTSIEIPNVSPPVRSPLRAPPAIQFERTDASLFASVRTLPQKAGVAPEHLWKLVFKELADNALDAGAEVSFRRDADGCTWVIDNGHGIDGTDEDIAALYSFGRPLRSSKLLRLPTRGALGNGLRVVAGLVYCTGGVLVVRTCGRELTLRPLHNGDTIVEASVPWDGEGTEVGVDVRHVGEEDEHDDEEEEEDEEEEDGDDALDWARIAASHVGESTYAGKSSPHWYDAETFHALCASASGDTYVRKLVEELDGCTGRKAGEIAGPLLNRLARDLTREEADALLDRARTAAKEVTPKRLGLVGRQVGSAFPGYGKAADYVNVSGARLPVVVEAWARATGVDESRVTLLVNRTRAPGAMHCRAVKKSFSISGCEYWTSNLPSGGHGYVIEVNVQTPFMPILSDGKEPNLSAFVLLLDDAIKQAVTRAKRAAGALDEGRTSGPRPTFKGSVLEHLDGAVEIVSSGGAHRYNLRNLFYAVRPLVMQDVGRALTYQRFGDVITDYENEHGPIDGLYRNERGVLIHPHTGDQTRLGTLNVEGYERPAWTFNKVLYVEKEGFFQMLQDHRWPERHDCALMTSQGYASRAARDLIDALGDGDEPIEIFCVHDADAFGTKIYEAFQDATKARPGRRVTIVNLGLERAEAEEMKLDVEELSPSKRDKPVAAYVSEEDKEWYQTNRYELNAMTPEQFLAWLDEKMATHAKGKVIPPVATVEEHFRDELESRVRQRLTDQVLAEAGIDDLVARAVESYEPTVARALESMEADIDGAFTADRSASWRDVVAERAQRLLSPRRRTPASPRPAGEGQRRLAESAWTTYIHTLGGPRGHDGDDRG